jgi:hypothetical protein
MLIDQMALSSRLRDFKSRINGSAVVSQRRRNENSLTIRVQAYSDKDHQNEF